MGAFYADTTHGYYLNSNSGPLHYAPGVTINAARGGSGVDTLVVDGSGDTSLGAGATWTNASGSLTVHVSSLIGAGADVSVDFTPAQAFTTVGNPTLSGSATVGGSVGLDAGTWSPAPTTLQVRWYAGGQPWTGHNDATQVVPGPGQVGQQVFARVTAIRAGYQTTTVDSAPVTVQPGTIPVTGNPTITGPVQVGSTLQSHVGTWGSVLSTVSSTWQWRADGSDIPGATSATYTVQSGDVGKTLSVAEHLTATGYQATTLVSGSTVVVPVPVITPAPAPTISGTPRVGAPLQAVTGTWMTGVTFSYTWSVDGSPVAGATSATYRPRPADLGKVVHVAVTGSKPGYPDVTTTSTDTAVVGLGVLSTSKPTILGLTKVGKKLTAVAGVWTRGTTLGYAWYANGKAIKHATAKRLTLTKAQKGKRITVKVTGKQAGYTTARRRQPGPRGHLAPRPGCTSVQRRDCRRLPVGLKRDQPGVVPSEGGGDPDPAGRLPVP